MAERIPIQVEKLNERYCGKDTGRIVFHTSTLGCNRMGAVLGRGYSVEESLRDWVFRAKADGHKVERKDLAEPKLVNRTQPAAAK